MVKTERNALQRRGERRGFEFHKRSGSFNLLGLVEVGLEILEGEVSTLGEVSPFGGRFRSRGRFPLQKFLLALWERWIRADPTPGSLPFRRANQGRRGGSLQLNARLEISFWPFKPGGASLGPR